MNYRDTQHVPKELAWILDLTLGETVEHLRMLQLNTTGSLMIARTRLFDYHLSLSPAKRRESICVDEIEYTDFRLTSESSRSLRGVLPLNDQDIARPNAIGDRNVGLQISGVLTKPDAELVTSNVHEHIVISDRASGVSTLVDFDRLREKLKTVA